MKNNSIKITTIIGLFMLLILTGTVGYILLLDISFIDALYMTVITISTVGYKEVAEMNPQAKLFSIFIIFWGIGSVGYTFSTLMVLLMEGEFKELWRNRVINKKISELKDHYIICGGGKTGEVIAERFEKEKVPFVLIDADEHIYSKWIERDILIIYGNATISDVLEQAKIHDAKGLISCLPQDVDNIVTVLTSRGLNKDVYIVSKAIEDDCVEKLKQVGANKIISINKISGRRMAALILHPNITNFLDVITRVGDMEIDLEDVPITISSSLVGKTLREASIPNKTGLIVLAIRKGCGEKIVFNPRSEFIIEVGDTLIVMGTDEQIDSLKRYV